MKIKSKTKMAIGILAFLLSVGLLQAQQVTTGGIPTGNGQTKEQWIKSNPDAYKAAGGQLDGADVAKKKEATALASTPQSEAIAPIAATTHPWGADENKAAWIAAHPREYAELTADTRIRVTRDEFNALPANKRISMQNDPNYVIVDAPKTATSTTTH